MPSKAITATRMGDMLVSVRMARLYRMSSFRPLFGPPGFTDNARYQHFTTTRKELPMSTSPRRALIVIDVQNEYFSGDLPITYPSTDLSLPNIVRAMRVAAEAGIPVITVQHEAPEQSPIFARGSRGWELHPLVAAERADHHVVKKMASSLVGTGLREWLAAREVDTLTIVGYMSHNCDASTILQAAHEGLQVEFLSDASGSLPYENAAGSASAEEIHRVFSVVFHSSFAAVASTSDWIDAVQEGRKLERDSIYVSNQRARKRADR
jgi:nicotinamidase-related amidase